MMARFPFSLKVCFPAKKCLVILFVEKNIELVENKWRIIWINSSRKYHNENDGNIKQLMIPSIQLGHSNTPQNLLLKKKLDKTLIY